MKLYVLTIVAYIWEEIKQEVFFEKEEAVKAFNKEKDACDRLLEENWYRWEREWGDDNGMTTDDMYHDDLKIQIYLREFDFEIWLREMTNSDILDYIKT